MQEIRNATCVPGNCLRCRYAKPLIQTDFTFLLDERRKATQIHCGRIGKTRPVYLSTEEDCPLITRKSTSRHRLGDMRQFISPLERLLVKQLWSHANYTFLCGLTGRGYPALAEMAKNLGLPPKTRGISKATMSAAAVVTKKARGVFMSDEQKAIILSYYDAGRWPSKNPTKRQEREDKRLKEEILTRVRKAGSYTVTWRGCIRLVYRESPAFKRKLARQKNHANHS